VELRYAASPIDLGCDSRHEHPVHTGVRVPVFEDSVMAWSARPPPRKESAGLYCVVVRIVHRPLAHVLHYPPPPTSTGLDLGPEVMIISSGVCRPGPAEGPKKYYWPRSVAASPSCCHGRQLTTWPTSDYDFFFVESQKKTQQLPLFSRLNGRGNLGRGGVGDRFRGFTPLRCVRRATRPPTRACVCAPGNTRQE